MARVLMTGGLLLDPEAAEPRAGRVLIEGERIAAVLPAGGPEPDDAERVELDGAGLAPGFLDLHHHGGLIFAAPGDFEPVLRATCASLPASGTTGFLPTTVAWPAPALARNVGRLAALLPELAGEGAVPLGLHLEGPWIEPKAAGAQPSAGIRGYEPEEGEEVLARAEGWLRMVTFAPEVPGVAELQQALELRGVVAALGHSLAGAELAEAAVDRGARHVTHLWNAMGPLHHREPGLVGVGLADDRLSCDLICDGAHVDPRAVRLAHRVKGGKLVLITDRIDPPPGSASFGSGPLCDDGVALRLADGRLAGSRLSLDRAVANARRFAGLSLLEAVAACTLAPARVLGIESERGTLRSGARADLVVLDRDGAVRETWIGGIRRFGVS